MSLIESVPNFSEGRDPAVLDAIVAAMLEVPGAYLLGREMDADHHRSVVTLAGEAEAVAEAVVRGVGVAAERIDLRRHRGAHPRVGATDVVPFVPLEQTSLEECVRWAEWAGAEIWRRYQIPVYLYEAAARRPERRQLEVVRRGQFEGLSQEVRTDPERQPDFGPPFERAALHPTAGATIVGARKFLIAYNINLDTANVEIARAIARAIRASSGGLPALNAMGVRLSDPPRAQVSMNLTDFSVTSLATVWRAVETEAARHGVHAVESELVGLLPRAAIESAGAEMLRFASFDLQRVIEDRLAEVRSAAKLRHGASLQPWLEALAGRPSGSFPATGAPTPGTVAAATGAMAAALAERAAVLATAWAERAALQSGDAASALKFWRLAAAGYRSLRQELTREVDDDSEAGAALLAARRLAVTAASAAATAESAPLAAVEAAATHAAEVPLRTAVFCLKLLQQIETMSPPGAHPRVPGGAGELAVAARLAEAAYHTAAACVQTGLRELPDGYPARTRMELQLEKLAAAAADRHSPDGS